MIRNGDHWLSVPANAVTENTEFTFKIVGGKNIKVDFSAKKIKNKAPVRTFSKALTLGLSYKDAKIADPSKLYIVYIVENGFTGLRERLTSTVYADIKIVAAPIWHFSEYEVAVD